MGKSSWWEILNKGYYEIRLESIGGLGANLCGKMLGELGIKYLGVNASGFSSYGSEKTGTPVKAYIRYCDSAREIRDHSPVRHPHLLVIFHEALLEKENVLEGVTEETKILLNTDLSPAQVIAKYHMVSKHLYLVSAWKIAMNCGARINTVMLGAIGKVMGMVTLEQVNHICRDTLGKKYPDALKGNLEGIKEGYTGVKEYLSGEEEKIIRKNSAAMEGDRYNPLLHSIEEQWGYMTAPIGGINPQYGNSVINDVSPSRQGYIPLFIQERCINCGQCDVTCPDMVFQFQKGMYKGREMMVNKGLDYYHCKGCLRCVTICPSNALVMAKEVDYPHKPYFMRNQDLLREPEYYEETGPDGYITSESFFTEKRMDGGEV